MSRAVWPPGGRRPDGLRRPRAMGPRKWHGRAAASAAARPAS